MAKFKRNNLELKTNQRIFLGNSNDSQIRFDGTNLLLNSSASIELYHAGNKVLETESEGLQIWNSGLSTSTRMYHGASYFRIDNERLDDSFYIRGYRTGSGIAKNMFYAHPNAGATLYYEGSTMFEVLDGEVKVNSAVGGKKLSIEHDGDDALFRNENDGGGIKLQVEVATDTVNDVLVGLAGGSTELYHDGIKVFETDSTGANFIGTVTGDYFVGDGSLLTNLSVAAGSYISQGNSDVTVTDAGVGKVEITVDGTEMMEVTSTTMSLNYAGVKTLETDATGIIVTGNITCDDLFTAGSTVYIGSDKKLDQDGLSYFDGGEWKLSVRLATFGPAWMYYDGNKALSTGEDGAIVWHPTSTSPSLHFQSNVGALLFDILASSSDVVLQNYMHSGQIIMKGDNSGGSVHTLLAADPDGSVDFYYDGGKCFKTRNDGIVVSSIDEGEEAQIYVSAATDYLILTSSATSGGIKLIGTNDGDSSSDLLIGDPDGAVDLYYDGQLTASTNSWGMTLKDDTFPSLGFELDGDTDTTTYIYQNDTDWQFNCNMPGSNIIFRSTTTGEVVKQLVKLDPDGDIEIISTDNIIIDAGDTGNSKYIENKWRNDGYFYTFHYLSAFYPSPTNALSLGKSGNVWKDVWATDTTINTSDERKKENIITSDLGLDFINELIPRSFKYKDYEGDELLPDGTSTVHVSNTYVRTHYGLIAQEVKQTMDSLGIDSTAFAGYIYDEENDFYGLRLGEFISPIIKAVQELKAINEEQQTEIDAQQTQINDLISRVEALEGA
jgi:hypothetical protein